MPTRTASALASLRPSSLLPQPLPLFSTQEEPTLVRSREHGRSGQVRVLLLNGLLPGLRINLAIGLL